MLQQTQQADTQRDLQLNEQVAQNAQLQHRNEVSQEQIRTRGNFNFLLVYRIPTHSDKSLES